MPDTISATPEQKKPFSDKFFDELDKEGDESDTESSGEEGTVKSGFTGGSTLQTNKTAREIELEDANEVLAEQNGKLQASNKTLTADVADLRHKIATMEVKMVVREKAMMDEMKKMIQDSKKEDSTGAMHSPDRTPKPNCEKAEFDKIGATGIVSDLAQNMFGEGTDNSDGETQMD